MIFRLVIVGKTTPSLNVLMRTHHYARKRESADWSARILYALRRAGHDKDALRATGKRRLVIERHGKKLLDTDNLAGAKDLIDEIRKFGFLVDDRPDLCELILRQEKLTPKQQQYTVIEISDTQ